MSKSLPTLQSKNLQLTAKPEDFALYKAALEWSLLDPIVIESRNDIKSERVWNEGVTPYHHQVTNLITFCRRLPVTLLADDVGLGKTISAGLVISELMVRGRVSKILIVCPKLLLPQWEEELRTKFKIHSVPAVGRELLSVKLPDDKGAVITTYHSARIYLDRLAKSGFEMLILDEAHKLRNLYGVDPTPQVALKFKQALSERMFRYVLMLTATPIQNRLWDIYSLVDLLTVARGHQNPFGSPGVFGRKFIQGDKVEARKLNSEFQEEFRNIVYGYMSRIRRNDAGLHFPERKVILQRAKPTSEELHLISFIGETIIKKQDVKLNRLAEISLLKSVVSSPEALVSQVKNMAANGTVPKSFADEVKDLAKEIVTPAKLQGLANLISSLRKERPDDWRVVIFTQYRETQTSIQIFLDEQGIPYGTINGSSGARNQETIKKFKKDVPEVNVIVSTEAGSEGVNLQVANVLVNYDLPWNPMIVEQRIGRIQRLASKHENVCIYNMTLEGTFEEYIVGRLMEKLQMASHAIGDVEALLEASGMNESEDENEVGFEEMIRRLVLASLSGSDFEKAAQKAEKSIAEAKVKLEIEQKNIDTMLGSMDSKDAGPQCPRLPEVIRSMSSEEFVNEANEYFKELGLKKTEAESYIPGTSSFDRLVQRVAALGKHRVVDSDKNVEKCSQDIAVSWIESFGGHFNQVNVSGIKRCFKGTAIVMARISVAHDSYERLVSIECLPDEHRQRALDRSALDPVSVFIDIPESVGLDAAELVKKALLDPGVAEFCRFYNERRSQEVESAGGDERKTKKLQDDFTPRIELTLVALEGAVHRELEVKSKYCFEDAHEYESLIQVRPSSGEIISAPEFENCSVIKKSVPVDCLGECEVSHKKALKHLLVTSETSGRAALPEFTEICTLSKKRALLDELQRSDLTNKYILPNLLKISAISGKKGEPKYFDICEFTSAEVLKDELVKSQFSGKLYRNDEELQSAVSGKNGHKQEFIVCSETGKILLPIESETCEVTHKIVMPGILEICEVSKKKVLPSELEKSAVSGKRALRKFFVSSSLSEARILEDEAVRSISGKYCTPSEAKSCAWSGRMSHLDDLKLCQLTRLAIHSEFLVTRNNATFLEALIQILNGVPGKNQKSDIWQEIQESVAKTLGGARVKVEFAELSPLGNQLALCLEVKTWGGLKTRHNGFLYSLDSTSVSSRIASGKRDEKGWTEA